MIRTVGIFPNPTKENWRKVTEQVIEFLAKRDKRAVMDPSFLAKYPMKGVEDGRSLDDADMVISLGGDGTLLNLIGKLRNHDLPILGVNLGSLGFLTEYTVDTVFDALEKVLDGDFTTQSRIALQGTLIRNDKAVTKHIALNDVVITHENIARLLTITVYFEEDYVTTYQADGLIVCTPTGSTAYSLSAGGPILMPTLDAILLTPICPHTITNRPILVPGDRKIKIVLPEPGTGATMTIDGQTGVPIQKGDIIEVERAPRTIKLIKCPSTSFFGVLRNKLGWSGSKGFDKE